MSNRFDIKKEFDSVPYDTTKKKFVATEKQIEFYTRGFLKVNDLDWKMIPYKSKICGLKKDGTFLIGGYITSKSYKNNIRKFLLKSNDPSKRKKKGDAINMGFWIVLSEYKTIWMKIHYETLIETQTLVGFAKYQTEHNKKISRELTRLKNKLAKLEKSK